MNAAFFEHVNTLDELQAAYRKHLLELHPDRHANEGEDAVQRFTVLTQELNKQYAYMASLLRAAEQREKAYAAGKPEPTTADFEHWARVDETLRQAIEKIVFLPDLEIELCGFWVWVGGDTRAVKAHLKAAGYHWAPKKSKWYYAGVPSSSRGGFNMDDIRARYGSTHIPNRNREYARIDQAQEPAW